MLAGVEVRFLLDSIPNGIEEVPSGALGIRAETRAIPVRGLEQVAKLIAEYAVQDLVSET